MLSISVDSSVTCFIWFKDESGQAGIIFLHSNNMAVPAVKLFLRGLSQVPVGFPPGGVCPYKHWAHQSCTHHIKVSSMHISAKASFWWRHNLQWVVQLMLLSDLARK